MGCGAVGTGKEGGISADGKVQTTLSSPPPKKITLKSCLRNDPLSSLVLRPCAQIGCQSRVAAWEKTFSGCSHQQSMEGLLDIRGADHPPAQSHSFRSLPPPPGIPIVLIGKTGVWGPRKCVIFPIEEWVSVFISSKKRLSLELEEAVWSDTVSLR